MVTLHSHTVTHSMLQNNSLTSPQISSWKPSENMSLEGKSSMPIQWIRTHQKPLRTIIIEEEEAHEGHDLKNLEELWHKSTTVCVQWFRTHQKPLKTITIEEEEACEVHDLKNREELWHKITTVCIFNICIV